MGYEIHITRRACWIDEDGPSINLDEWKALIMGDPEMRWEEPADAVWIAYSKQGRDGALFYLGLTGDIIVKNPDKAILVKMYQIAQKLSAKVQGDEQEIYDFKGNVVRSSVPRSKNQLVSLLVSILVLMFAVGVFVILGLWATFVVLILSTLVFVILRLIASK